MRPIALSISLLLIASTANAQNTAREDAWVAQGMDTVRELLRDPGSAEFRDVYFNRGADDIPVTCGEVNSRNAYGGYSGFQRFVSAGSPDLTFLEEQVADFDTVWRQLCR